MTTRWASLLGALGMVAIGFGLLTAILGLFQPVMDFYWVLGNLAVGVVLLGASVVSSLDSLRERMSSGEAKRVGRYGTSAMLSATAGIFILCVFAYLTSQDEFSTRFDWTEQSVHTLTSQSLNLLDDLEEDVQVTAFFNAVDAPSVRDLLERYSYASDRFKLEFVDPNARPGLVQELGIDEADLSRGLVRIAIGEQSVEVQEFSEYEITNALLKLVRGGGKKVYFLEGHNERVVEGEGADGKEGFARVANALRNETYEVEGLLLAERGEVPEDANALVIAGPTRPLLDPERGALVRYLARGGALLVMVDPSANTDIHGLLGDWGVEIGDDVILDRENALFGRPASPVARRYADHPITAELREPALFHVASSVVIDQAADGDYETIVYTGANAWAERDIEGWRRTSRATFDDGADMMGPVPLAVAGTLDLGSGNGGLTSQDDPTPSGTEARIVVFGDSDFVTNEYVDAFRNRDLFVNSVNWLMGDVDQIALRPNVSRASRFQLTADDFRRIRYLSLFVIPEAIAVIGVLAWWSRRQPSGS